MNAQTSEKTTLAEQNFRATLFAQMENEAKKAGISLMPGKIAYAAGDGGLLVNTAIKGTDKLDPQNLTKGTDLLFVHVGTGSTVVPEGYYKVRLADKQPNSLP